MNNKINICCAYLLAVALLSVPSHAQQADSSLSPLVDDSLSSMVDDSLSSMVDDSLSPMVDDTGTISLDPEFRLELQHLGSWFVPEGGASGFHDVLTQASSIEYYREHGVFPDGAVIVKELRGAAVGNYSTGQGVQYSVDDVKQWFVMIKDSKNRFADNPNWGDGWGWALFKPGDQSTVNVSADYKADCLGCHVPAKDNDWIYTEAYPVLRD